MHIWMTSQFAGYAVLFQVGDKMSRAVLFLHLSKPMTSKPADIIEAENRGFAKAIEAAAQIVQAAREGEHDTDFRSILHSIRALKGTPHDH